MEDEITVNKAGAKLFYEQCMGNYSGHMSLIPNNPVLQSICTAHGVTSKMEFAEFLRAIADELENEPF